MGLLQLFQKMGFQLTPVTVEYQVGPFRPMSETLTTPDLSRQISGLMGIAVEQHRRITQRIRDNARIWELDHCLDLVNRLPEPGKTLKGGL